jgi:hypothetical protein
MLCGTKLKHQRSARNDARPSGKKVATHETFQHRGLSNRLRTDDSYQRKTEISMKTNTSQNSMQHVHYPKWVFLGGYGREAHILRW